MGRITAREAAGQPRFEHVARFFSARFSALIVALFIAVGLSACSHVLYRTHDYEPAVVTLAAGTLHVETLPRTYAENRASKVYEQRGPYTFRLFFLTEDAPGEAIRIAVRNLAELGEEAALFFIEETTRRDTFPVTQPPITTTGHISLITDADTNHEPVTLQIDVTYKGRTESVTVPLVPRYHESRRELVGD